MTRYWLGLWAGLCTLAWADQPPPPVTDDAGLQDEFLEFLGADDVGDAAWWDFLTRMATHSEAPDPATPLQDAKP